MMITNFSGLMQNRKYRRITKNRFDGVTPFMYETGIHERTFNVGGKNPQSEAWLVIDGYMDITPIKQVKSLKVKVKAGDVIIFSANEKVKIEVSKEYVIIKKNYADEDYEDEVKANLMINYNIIEIIAEVLDKNERFLGLKWDDVNDYRGDNFRRLFKGAKEGNIYKYFEMCNTANKLIEELHITTGIATDIWEGKTRILTGFTYKGNKIVLGKNDTTHIDEVKKINDKTELKNILSDPIDLTGTEEFTLKKIMKHLVNHEKSVEGIQRVRSNKRIKTIIEKLKNNDITLF
ncbi:MAG TPA: hypothetical protein DCP90_07910 [Clostridiales bacterium]|nr:MAG: hypothetical protein A2Y22_06105 [Clostridiales bacterium GWD2_32_59]HAN10524.1 hypothetical protein [Clostridiales bacterium]